MDEESLVRLIRRNWVNIFSIKSIINNIANPSGETKTFQFGKDKKKDELFIKTMKSRLLPRTSQKLGILSISNSKLLDEMSVINKGIIEGSPKLEIIEICNDDECIEEVIVPGEDCPKQEEIEDVSIQYEEVCSTSNLICPPQPPPKVTPCAVDDCILFAQKECNFITKVSKTGYFIYKIIICNIRFNQSDF